LIKHYLSKKLNAKAQRPEATKRVYHRDHREKRREQGEVWVYLSIACERLLSPSPSLCDLCGKISLDLLHFLCGFGSLRLLNNLSYFSKEPEYVKDETTIAPPAGSFAFKFFFVN